MQVFMRCVSWRSSRRVRGGSRDLAIVAAAHSVGWQVPKNMSPKMVAAAVAATKPSYTSEANLDERVKVRKIASCSSPAFYSHLYFFTLSWRD